MGARDWQRRRHGRAAGALARSTGVGTGVPGGHWMMGSGA